MTTEPLPDRAHTGGELKQDTFNPKIKDHFQFNLKKNFVPEEQLKALRAVEQRHNEVKCNSDYSV